MMIVAIASSVMYGYFATFREDVDYGCEGLVLTVDRDLTSDEL